MLLSCLFLALFHSHSFSYDAHEFPPTFFSSAANNSLTSVDFTPYSSLTYLDLSYNSIRSLSSSLFNQFYSASYYLDHNQIVMLPYLPSSTYSYSHKLLKMDLSFNKLKSIPESIENLNLDELFAILCLHINYPSQLMVVEQDH